MVMRDILFEVGSTVRVGMTTEGNRVKEIKALIAETPEFEGMKWVVRYAAPRKNFTNHRVSRACTQYYTDVVIPEDDTRLVKFCYGVDRVFGKGAFSRNTKESTAV